jgi:hypothetical protein
MNLDGAEVNDALGLPANRRRPDCGDTHAFIYVLGRMIDLNDLILARVGTVFDAEAVTDQA